MKVHTAGQCPLCFGWTIISISDSDHISFSPLPGVLPVVFGTPFLGTVTGLRPAMRWREPFRRFTYSSGSDISFLAIKLRVCYIPLQRPCFIICPVETMDQCGCRDQQRRCVKHTASYLVVGSCSPQVGSVVADSQGVTSRGTLVLRGRNLFPVETSREGAEEVCGLSSIPSPL